MYCEDVHSLDRVGRERPAPLLSGWHPGAAGTVEGWVHGDPRFVDGTRVRTSPAVLLAPPLLVTRNTVYRLAP